MSAGGLGAVCLLLFLALAWTRYTLSQVRGQLLHLARGLAPGREPPRRSELDLLPESLVDSVLGLHEETRRVLRDRDEDRASLGHQVEVLGRIAGRMERTGEALKGSFQDLSRELEGLSHTGRAIQGQLGVSGENIPQWGKLLEQIRSELLELARELESLDQRWSRGIQRAGDLGELAARADLLAVNAHIEGQQSRGEDRGASVVAREIRRLAEKLLAQEATWSQTLEEGRSLRAQGQERMELLQEGFATLSEEAEQLEELLLGALHAARLQEGAGGRLGEMVDELAFEVHQAGAAREHLLDVLQQLRRLLGEAQRGAENPDGG